MKSKVASAFICACVCAAVGCDSVNGDLDGMEFGRIKTALYGEVKTDSADALNIYLSDLRFTCEDLTQNWTPDEEDAFDSFNTMSITTFDADDGEFDFDADDYDERLSATINVWDDGLDLDDTFRANDGTVTIDGWNEGRSLNGEFDLTFYDSSNDDEYDVTGKFSAVFCRNLSVIDG